jgi:hypothetical protein
MTRDKVDRMREALRGLPTLGRTELRAEWHRLYGTDARVRLGRALLLAALANRLQEDAVGRLRPDLRRRLRHIVESVRRGDEVVSAAPHLKPGTRLMREWQGHTHEILVVDGGFLWQQARYRSLSQIARAITGTRWSGPVFFGLKPRTAARRSGGLGVDDAI